MISHVISAFCGGIALMRCGRPQSLSPSGKSLPVKCRNGGNGYIATVEIEENGKGDEREMKTSNANKVISVLMSVAMCPMMVPSAAFAADDDAASGGGSSSSTKLTQSSGQAEGADTGASSGTAPAAQPETTGEAAGTTATSNENAAPAATASGAASAAATGEEGGESATGEESAEAAVAEVNDNSYPSLQEAIDAAPKSATVKLLANTKENVTISTYGVVLDFEWSYLEWWYGCGQACAVRYEPRYRHGQQRSPDRYHHA